jgi:DNA replication regulator SLD3
VANGGLYIVERVKRGIYSLSKLARWVHEGNLVVAAKGWHATDPTEADGFMVVDEPRVVSDDYDWWQAAQIEEPLSEIGVREKSTGLSVALVFGPSDEDFQSTEPSFIGVVEHRSQSLAPLRSFDAANGDPFLLPESQGLGDFAEAMEVDGVEPNIADVQQSPEELLDGMRDHYLQALYVSKVILCSKFQVCCGLQVLDFCGILREGAVNALSDCFPSP